MNNSAKKQLIREKGFLYANSAGMVTLIKPDAARAIHTTATIIEWLQGLSDVVKPAIEYRGRYIGDQVQIFSPVEGYFYWGLIGRIVKVTADRKEGTLVEVQFDELNSIIIPGNAVTVINREGVVDLRDMSKEEREAAVNLMMGISAQNEELKSFPIPTCECLNDECEIHMDTENWSHLNAARDDKDYRIVSDQCPNFEGLSDVVMRSGDLLMVKVLP